MIRRSDGLLHQIDGFIGQKSEISRSFFAESDDKNKAELSFATGLWPCDDDPGNEWFRYAAVALSRGDVIVLSISR